MNKRLVLLLALSFSALTSLATPVLNYNAGQLVGADGVSVGGVLYNVEFLEGSCVSLFNGCDSPSDFTFNTWPGVHEALHALLDQVISQLGNTPTGIYGCSVNAACLIATPYGTIFNDQLALLGLAITTQWDDVEGVIWAVLPSGFDVGISDIKVYARWTQVVPVPAALWLFGTGLLGLGLVGRRRKQFM